MTVRSRPSKFLPFRAAIAARACSSLENSTKPTPRLSAFVCNPADGVPDGLWAS